MTVTLKIDFEVNIPQIIKILNKFTYDPHSECVVKDALFAEIVEHKRTQIIEQLRTQVERMIKCVNTKTEPPRNQYCGQYKEER